MLSTHFFNHDCTQIVMTLSTGPPIRIAILTTSQLCFVQCGSTLNWPGSPPACLPAPPPPLCCSGGGGQAGGVVRPAGAVRADVHPEHQGLPDSARGGPVRGRRHHAVHAAREGRHAAPQLPADGVHHQDAGVPRARGDGQTFFRGTKFPPGFRLFWRPLFSFFF